MKKKDYFRKTSEDDCYFKNEFSDDIVFARFVNYMKISLLRKKLDYDKHQDFLSRQEKNMSVEEWSVLSNNDSSVHSFFAFCQDCNKLKNAIQKLTEKQKIVIIHYYYKNYSISKIANTLNMTRNGVKQLKLRAIANLKRYMED